MLADMPLKLTLRILGFLLTVFRQLTQSREIGLWQCGATVLHTLHGSHIPCCEIPVVLQQSIFDSAVHTEGGSISSSYREVAVAPNASAQKTWPISDSGNWYDLTISANGIERRFAGRMENGQNLTSDPAMAS
jgi:Bacterial phospholipase C, C-terminal domain